MRTTKIFRRRPNINENYMCGVVQHAGTPGSICVVLYNMQTHQGRADRAPTPANDVAGQQNEMNKQCMCQMRTTGIFRGRPNKRELLKDYFSHMGALVKDYFSHMWGIGWVGGQDLRFVNLQTWGKKLASISPFQD